MAKLARLWHRSLPNNPSQRLGLSCKRRRCLCLAPRRLGPPVRILDLLKRIRTLRRNGPLPLPTRCLIVGQGLHGLLIVRQLFDRESTPLLPCCPQHLVLPSPETGIVFKRTPHFQPGSANGTLPTRTDQQLRLKPILEHDQVLDGSRATVHPTARFVATHALDLLNHVVPVNGSEVASAQRFGLLHRPRIGVGQIQFVKSPGRPFGRYVEYFVMWSWAAKPLLRNTFSEVYST